MCNHVAVLNRGRVIAQGPVDELLRRGKMLQVRVSDVDTAVSLLKDLDWIKTIETEEGLIFVETDEAHFPEVNEILVRSGIRVSEMKMSSESLEDFFLEAIEEQGKEAGDA